MALMENRREPPRDWPTSECEFILIPHLHAQFAHHLAVECEIPDSCQCAASLFAHGVALTALFDLRILWDKRKPAF